MSSIGDNINALIETIKVSEDYAESQINELQSVETEISQIKSEMLTMSSEKEELKNDLRKLLTEVNKQDSSVMSLEREVKILRDVHKELKDTYDKESGILNEKQQEVWTNRDLFCNNLRQFAEDWGPLSTPVTKNDKNTVSKKEIPSVSQGEELLENDLINLEKSVAEAKHKFAEVEENLKNAKLLREKLSEEPECGEEFLSLREYLRRAQVETADLKRQIEEAKQGNRYNCQSKDSRHLLFFSEPPLTHCLAAKTTSFLMACENSSFCGEIQSVQEGGQPSSSDENSSWKNAVNGPYNIRKLGVKRPIAPVAPALEQYYQGKENEQNVASNPKKSCPFVPKKPSSLSKKFFTHSNGWEQLEKELSHLLRNDLPVSKEEV